MGTQDATAYADNDYFKMGAAVAIGELLDAGMLRAGLPAGELRSFLASFGLESRRDLEAIGMGEVYAGDFDGVF